jgi:glycerophosphoryl diester phosphodiesterase
MTGAGGPVGELTLAEVRALRLTGSDEPIPTMDEVLSVVDGAVPVVVDVRRWGFGGSAELETAVADRLRGYGADAVTQSFDPLAVRRLRSRLPDRAVGQASGTLRSAGPVARVLGQMMLTNALTRPDFVTFELALLPNRYASFWRTRDRPLIAYTAYSEADEERACAVADGVYFNGYVPKVYRD